MLRTFAIVVALAGFAAGCSGPQKPEFGRPDQEAIRKLTQDMVGAYNAKDPAKTASYFAGNAVLMPPNSSAVRGKDAVQTFYENRFKQGVNALEVTPEEVVGSGDLAYMTGSYTLTLRPEGGAEQRDRGKVLWVARRMQGNGWRWQYEMWSSDLQKPVQ